MRNAAGGGDGRDRGATSAPSPRAHPQEKGDGTLGRHTAGTVVLPAHVLPVVSTRVNTTNATVSPRPPYFPITICSSLAISSSFRSTALLAPATLARMARSCSSSSATAAAP